MGMNNNEEKRSVGAHNLILEERGNLTITGVEDVDAMLHFLLPEAGWQIGIM